MSRRRRELPWQAIDVNAPEVEVLDAVDAELLPDLMELFASAWWATHRTTADVPQMLAASDLVFALVHRKPKRLVGFARVLTDEVYLAVVLDVIVSPAVRGSGLGAMLIDAIVEHPRLADVHSVELVCQPDMVPFYQRWGFTDEVGHSRLMRRASVR